jgi:hypothetical protein
MECSLPQRFTPSCHPERESGAGWSFEDLRMLVVDRSEVDDVVAAGAEPSWPTSVATKSFS